jgi:uncharacterized membrane protein YfcA
VNPDILILIVTFLAGFTQGLSGFGSILLALPLLTIFIDIKTVIPLVALHGLFMTIILLIELRRHLEWKKVFPLFAGSIPGVPIGVFFLKNMNTDVIQLTMGVILLSYALFSLFYRAVIWEMKKIGVLLVGFLAGCLGGALGASGPPVIVYTSLQPWNKDTIKVTLQGFFVASGLVVVILHALNGLTTILVFRYFLISLPALVVGTYVGSFFYGRIGENTYKKIMFILLALLGTFLIYGVL